MSATTWILVLLAVLVIVVLLWLWHRRLHYQAFSIRRWKKLYGGIHGRMFKLLGKITATLDDCNVCYWLHDGSLLGAARHRDIIPWDDDMDLVVYNRDDKMEEKERLVAVLQKAGFHCRKKFFGLQVYESRAKRDCWVDLFFFHQVNGELIVGTAKNQIKLPLEYYANEKEVFPLQRITFGVANAWIPQKTANVLSRIYGKNWWKEGRIVQPHTTHDIISTVDRWSLWKLNYPVPMPDENRRLAGALFGGNLRVPERASNQRATIA